MMLPGLETTRRFKRQRGFTLVEVMATLAVASLLLLSVALIAVMSAKVMRKNVLAGDAVHEALVEKDFSPERFAGYARFMRDGVENMRKLVYAFYDPNFSFREVIKRYPDAGGLITDCLSGDVNKDFSQLWSWIREFVPLPDDLPYGEPLVA